MDTEPFSRIVEANYGKIRVFAILMAVAALVILIVGKILEVANRPTFLEISVAPASSTMMINGKTYRNGVYEFEPGDYVLYIEKSKFGSAEIEFTVKKHESNVVNGYLLHETEGMRYFERKAEDLQVIRKIAASTEDEKLKDFVDAYDRKMQIFHTLPINISYSRYEDVNGGDDGVRYGNAIQEASIDNGSYRGDCNYIHCLYVTGIDKAHRYKVKEYLEKNGYQISDFEVLYEK